MTSHEVSDAILDFDSPYQEIKKTKDKLEFILEDANIDDAEKLEENLRRAEEIMNEFGNIAGALLNTYQMAEAVDEKQMDYMKQMQIYKDLFQN